MSDYNYPNKSKILIIFASCFSLSLWLSNYLFLAKAQSDLIADSNHKYPHNTSNSTQMEGHDHHHKTLEISDDSAIPTLEVIVHPDEVKGWNLEVKTTNFDFTPELLNRNSNPNQGHAHLFINGKKITRIYSNWYYISELPEGKNQIKVTLNTNQHEDLVYQGTVIADIVQIKN